MLIISVSPVFDGVDLGAIRVGGIGVGIVCSVVSASRSFSCPALPDPPHPSHR